MLDRGERPHRDAFGARVPDDDPLVDSGTDGGDQVVDGGVRHDRAADSGALLPGLRRELGDQLLDVGVEFGGAGHRIRTEHRSVDGVGLAGEPHAAGLHRIVGTEPLGRRRRTGEPDQVAEPQSVEQAGHGAGDELQRSVGKESGLHEDAHKRLREIAGGRRWLDEARHPGEEGRRELLERTPHREVERVDLHRHPGQAGVDVLAEERAVLRELLGRAVDVDGAVGQFAAALRRVGEQHADAAVDVDPRVRLRRPGAARERVQLLLALGERLGHLLQQHRALVEGHAPQRLLADGPRVVERCGQVEAGRADGGDHLAGRRVAHEGRFGLGRRIGRGPPGAVHIAGKDVRHGVALFELGRDGGWVH